MQKGKSAQSLPLPNVQPPEYLIKKLHSFEGKIADYITSLAGSMFFVYFHVSFFTLFFIFRPFPNDVFNILLSLEAIFLATFIMISQNRQALLETYREMEEEQEQKLEEQEQEELEEEVEDIQKDLDDIKNAMAFIQQKLSAVEKSRLTHTSESDKNS